MDIMRGTAAAAGYTMKEVFMANLLERGEKHGNALTGRESAGACGVNAGDRSADSKTSTPVSYGTSGIGTASLPWRDGVKRGQALKATCWR
jgi:hypothetical protein